MRRDRGGRLQVHTLPTEWGLNTKTNEIERFADMFWLGGDLWPIRLPVTGGPVVHEEPPKHRKMAHRSVEAFYRDPSVDGGDFYGQFRAQCWCGRQSVPISRQEVRAGVTRSCRRSLCVPRAGAPRFDMSGHNPKIRRWD